MKKNYRFMLIAISVALSSGCASLTGSEIQNLSLSVKNEKNETINDAKCTLKNDKGTWQTGAPAFVDVRRSAEDLLVECKKEGSAAGFLRAISRAAGGMFGNIIFGGGIGAIIDHNKGTGYNYPDNLPIIMGQSNTVDRATQNAETEKTAGNPSQAPQ